MSGGGQTQTGQQTLGQPSQTPNAMSPLAQALAKLGKNQDFTKRMNDALHPQLPQIPQAPQRPMGSFAPAPGPQMAAGLQNIDPAVLQAIRARQGGLMGYPGG